MVKARLVVLPVKIMAAPKALVMSGSIHFTVTALVTAERGTTVTNTFSAAPPAGRRLVPDSRHGQRRFLPFAG